jgi:hypothetical protein
MELISAVLNLLIFLHPGTADFSAMWYRQPACEFDLTPSFGAKFEDAWNLP